MAEKRTDKRQEFDHLVKLLLIGDSGVGKSCILLRFSEDDFNSSFVTTIGIDFKIKTITAQGKQLKLQIWDTAGQERFRTITNTYYRGAMGVLLVYDVGSKISFDNIRDWMKNVEQNASQTVNKILIGNKCDLQPHERQVPRESGEALAREFRIPFIETSAIANINVQQAFEKISLDVVARLASNPEPVKSSEAAPVPIWPKPVRPDKPKSRCC